MLFIAALVAFLSLDYRVRADSGPESPLPDESALDWYDEQDDVPSDEDISPRLTPLAAPASAHSW